MSSLNVRYEPSNLASFLLQKFKRGPLPSIFRRSGVVAPIQRLARVGGLCETQAYISTR